eukprot:gene7010-114_t
MNDAPIAPVMVATRAELIRASASVLCSSPGGKCEAQCDAPGPNARRQGLGGLLCPRSSSYILSLQGHE